MQNIDQSEPIDIIYYLIEAKSIPSWRKNKLGENIQKLKVNSHAFVIPQR